MPTFDMLRLRRPRPGVPVAPLTPLTPVTPLTGLAGTDGDRPPLADLTLLLAPLLNGKPTEEISTEHVFWIMRIGSRFQYNNKGLV